MQNLQYIPAWIKRVAVITAIVVIFIIVAAVISISNSRVQLTKVNLQASRDNLTQLIDGNYHIFNGLGFFKAPVESPSDITVLSSGSKLPSPSSIIWGEKGALLSFKGSFIYTQASDYLEKVAMPYDTRFESTWYYDFSSGNLRFIGPGAIQNSVGIYQKGSNSFYYAAGATSPDGRKFTEIHHYTVGDESRTVVNTRGTLSEVSAIEKCPNNIDEICAVITQDIEGLQSTVVSIKNTEESGNLLNVDGFILPANSPGIYLSFDNKDAISGGVDDTGPVAYSKAILYNFNDDTRTTIHRTLPVYDIVAGSLNNNVAVIDMSTYTTLGFSDTVFGRRINEQPIRNDGSDPTILPYVSQKDKGRFVFFDSQGALYVYGKPVIQPKLATEQVIKTLVESCSNDAVQRSIVEAASVEVIINDTDTFSDSVQSIGRCIAKKSEGTLPYYFRFSAVSPVNGKITSD